MVVLQVRSKIFSKMQNLDSTKLKMNDFQDWARQVALDMERTLSDLLPSPDVQPQRLHAAMRYSTLSGGKRVRPMLAFAAGLVTDADPERVKAVSAAVEIGRAHV